MFIDLTDSTIINEEMDREEDVQKHLLSSGMWAIVRPETSPSQTRTDDDDHFDSKISKHFKIDSDLYVVPVSAMVAPVAVIETPNIFAILTLIRCLKWMSFWKWDQDKCDLRTEVSS